MNYSAIFSEAHRMAKQTRDQFPSYRGAFSAALSAILRAEWAEIKAAKVADLNAKSQKSFIECPIQGAEFLGYVQLKDSDEVRRVFANERVFWIEGDVYDFECDNKSNLESFLSLNSKTGRLGVELGEKKARQISESKSKIEAPVKKPVYVPTSVKRAASGRGFGRSVANVRRLGINAMLYQ